MQFNILNGWMRAVLSIESKQWIGLVFGNKLLPKIKADPLPYKAQDGQVRRRYTVQIQMVKRHLQICLQKYYYVTIPTTQTYHSRFKFLSRKT
ncbi:hypothetical protein DSCO28_39430 [Desulfosarcina ovata subsp. sediminis]|uniref:Uncharacterized protein n=1 Tax=Desulfosarcina ovata subsp. sediminis TaxID=885957 RepID=A0A5K7ZT36_9BACT|nr:hypothetical protein DSCO28_39430 [Desulfosarcina ovata subsp. sediminis]